MTRALRTLCVLLRPWLCPAGSWISPLTRQNGVYCWAKGGSYTVLGFWGSFLDGLEVCILFLGWSLSGRSFFMWAACLRRVLVCGFQACTFACSFIHIAPESSLDPTVSGRVRGSLAGGRRDGLSLEVVGHIPCRWAVFVPT